LFAFKEEGEQLMTDVITYPTAAMKQTAQEIRALLDAQWQQHLILYNNAPHSLTNLTGALSKGVSGGPALMDHIHAWHQQMAKNYESLYALADALENGSINAITFDEGIKQLFGSYH
jgi:NAD(P)-dependent dehydrogenase (short-subunit alcohol dehydrogenase family)